MSILAPHFLRGEPQELDSHLMTLHRELVEVYEGMRRYPVVYYYHSRRPYRSIPYTFRMLGGIAGALRWGLPSGHPGSQTPWLPALITGLKTFIAYLEERFLFERLEEAPKPVPFKTFEMSFTQGEESSDTWLNRFLEVESGMREIAGIDELPDPNEAYGRYTEWLPFAYYEAAARDLGYTYDELAYRPGDWQF